jgi:hypothetical protein
MRQGRTRRAGRAKRGAGRNLSRFNVLALPPPQRQAANCIREVLYTPYLLDQSKVLKVFWRCHSSKHIFLLVRQRPQLEKPSIPSPPCGDAFVLVIRFVSYKSRRDQRRNSNSELRSHTTHNRSTSNRRALVLAIPPYIGDTIRYVHMRVNTSRIAWGVQQ